MNDPGPSHPQDLRKQHSDGIHKVFAFDSTFIYQLAASTMPVKMLLFNTGFYALGKHAFDVLYGNGKTVLYDLQLNSTEKAQLLFSKSKKNQLDISTLDR